MQAQAWNMSTEHRAWSTGHGDMEQEHRAKAQSTEHGASRTQGYGELEYRAWEHGAKAGQWSLRAQSVTSIMNCLCGQSTQYRAQTAKMWITDSLDSIQGN
jgi:hypothetical protein